MGFNDYPYTDFHEMNLDWVIKKVKELAAAWAQVQQDWTDEQAAFANLKSWIENYFNNLNVQTEINVKLDAMVAAGTMSELIAPYVASGLPAEVASQIGDVVALQIGPVVAAQISAVVADQLPAVAAAAAAQEVSAWLALHVDPETGYVIDDTFTIQGAAADAKAVGDEFTSIKSALSDLNNGKYRVSNIPVVQGYVDSSGTIITGYYTGLWVTDYIPIVLLCDKASYNAVTSSNYIAFYDVNKTFISKTTNPAQYPARQYDAFVPSNAKYIVLSTSQAERPTDLYVEFTVGGEIGKARNGLNPYVNFDLVNGYVDSSGTEIYSSTAGYKKTRKLPIPHGCTHIYHNFNTTSNNKWGIYDKDFQVLSYGNDLMITVPSDAAYFVSSDYNSTDLHEGLFVQFITSELFFNIENVSRYGAIRKKKIVLMGDSITDENVSGKWVKILRKKIYGLNITDYARGSAVWTNYDDTEYDLSTTNVGNHNNVIWNQYNRLMKDITDEVVEQPDYIFIFGGMNDILQNKPIGDSNTAYSGTMLDRDVTTVLTLLESIRYVVTLIRKNLPGTVICIGTPYGSSSYPGRSYNVANAIKDCADRMACPIVDWFGELGFSPWTEVEYRYYLSADYVHPSAKGDNALCDFNLLKFTEIIRD